ncbi:MAG TPA: threonine ammonia-lyase, biosynthetic [Gammaproteobacteria bacterium]|nr:threonine ammonia-lyase, biosynthetic [Gammaproteobacteria bacterium]
MLRARVYDVAIESPLDYAPSLSSRTGNRVFFKREDLQPIFSFKLRGAYNKISRLPADALARGVICSSAGNHAQGVALAARKHGCRAVIVMPTTTPPIKVRAVEQLGGEVILTGDNYDAASAHAETLATRHALALVHPFADPDVIAGQGTIALELKRQLREVPAAVFVPVGGGGLIGGIGALSKFLYPDVRIIGVEPFESPSMHEALRHGGPVDLKHVGIFADGVAVRRVSDETYRLAREVVDEIILVDTDEICAAIKDIFEDSRVVTEPAGALGVAGLKRYLDNRDDRDRLFVTINSGANINFDRLRHVAERADIGEHREALLAVRIPERPGAFRAFCRAVGTRSITEFNYRYSLEPDAKIFVGIGLRDGRREAARLIGQLRDAGYEVLDLTDNELAKIHVRHMVGGRVASLADEVIYRFEFPERPGALLEFLDAIGDRWNISLFHYRNHGSDYGRVLAGAQIPDAERPAFASHLDGLGYAFWDESANPAYRLFLRSPTVAAR